MLSFFAFGRLHGQPVSVQHLGNLLLVLSNRIPSLRNGFIRMGMCTRCVLQTLNVKPDRGTRYELRFPFSTTRPLLGTRETEKTISKDEWIRSLIHHDSTETVSRYCARTRLASPVRVSFAKNDHRRMRGQRPRTGVAMHGLCSYNWSSTSSTLFVVACLNRRRTRALNRGLRK